MTLFSLLMPLQEEKFFKDAEKVSRPELESQNENALICARVFIIRRGHKQHSASLKRMPTAVSSTGNWDSYGTRSFFFIFN